MCGNDFRVPIASHSHYFIPIPFPGLGKSLTVFQFPFIPKSNPDSLPFPFPLKQEQFKKLIVMHREE